MGVLKEWLLVKQPDDPSVPVVVSPLGVEPKKPRALWDGRYVNMFCRNIPFQMDSVSKVADVAWKGAYMFKVDHKTGYLHIPLHRDSWKFFGVCWKQVYYVITVLPFGASFSPLVYHSVTEAVAMYLRTLQIPIFDWIDDMLGMSSSQYKESSDECQYQSAVRNMVKTSRVLYGCGYFCSLKTSLENFKFRKFSR
jgi:hypothetical protein